MNAVTHLEKVITGEVSAVTHLEKVIAGETSAVTYTEKVITGEAPPITHLQKVIAGEASPVTHLEYVWAGGSPTPTEHEYTGAVPYTFTANGSPLISWRISGNTVQNGTPTPDSPIIPQGTGERTGNLFDKTTLENGIYLAANGNKYGDVTNGVRAGVKIKVLPNTAYTLSAQSSVNVSLRIFEWSNGTFTTQTPKYNISGNISLTVTTDAETTEIAFNIEGANGQYITNIMLNSGSTPLPYEPYGYFIEIEVS